MKRNWKEINQKGRLVCRKCGIEKSLCEFRKRGKSKIPDIQYHSLECKECQSERLIPIKSDGSIIICKNSHRYIKENGKWLFQLRKYAVLYNDNGTGNMTGTANPYPELIT